MIDTVKIKIPYEEKLMIEIRKRSMDYWQRGRTDTNLPSIKIITDDVVLGSYDRNINIRINPLEKTIFCEFSLAKYYFGHNIYLLYSKEAVIAINQFYKDLCKYFNFDFPKIETWELYRLDICYSWKLESQAVAEEIIFFLDNYDFPRKKKHTYQSRLTTTGIFCQGTEYGLKFYLKHQEFYQHDYREMMRRKKDMDLAYRLHELSNGILRYELTLRKSYLKRIFTGGIIEVLGNQEKIMEIMSEKLKQYLKCENPVFMSEMDVLDKLQEVYEKRTAFRLWLFYKEYNQSAYDGKQIIKRMFSRNTIYENLILLKKAGIGLSVPNISAKFDLNIPSDYAVNAPAVTR